VEVFPNPRSNGLSLADEPTPQSRHDNHKTHIWKCTARPACSSLAARKVIVTGLLQKPLPSVDGACDGISLCPKPPPTPNGLLSASGKVPRHPTRLPRIPRIWTLLPESAIRHQSVHSSWTLGAVMDRGGPWPPRPEVLKRYHRAARGSFLRPGFIHQVISRSCL
jgi:hypothetical protein